MTHAEGQGIAAREWSLPPSIPWLSRFRIFREAKLETLADGLPLDLTLSQIVPDDCRGHEGSNAEPL